MRGRVALAALVALVAGFLVWTSAFVSLYALFSLGCVHGWPLWHGVLLAVWAAHIALHGLLIAWVRRRTELPAGAEAGVGRFLRLGALGLAVASLGATVWSGLPVVFLSSCG